LKKLSKNKIISLIILVLSISFFYVNKNLKVSSYDILGSKFLPYVICSLMAILSIALFLKKEEREEEDKDEEKLNYGSIIRFSILTLFYLLALDYSISFLLSSFFYLMILTFMLSNYRLRSIPKIIFFSASVAYIIYSFFQNFLQLILP